MFSVKAEGFYPERVSLAPADVKQLGPMCHDIAAYIQGIGILPTSREATILAELRATRQEEIQEIQLKYREVLLSLNAMCESLITMKDTLEAKSKQVVLISSILAPIRRLPLELLTKIFRLTVSSQHSPPRETDSPLLLCRVCTLWKGVALKDPALWSHIACRYPVPHDHIDSDEFYDSDGEQIRPYTDENIVVRAYQRLFNSVQVFAERSMNVPLFLTIYNHPTDTISIPSPSTTLQESAFELMVTLFPRCQSLKLWAESGWANTLFRSLAPGMVPQLRELELHISRKVTHEVLAATDTFAHSPLQSYRLHSDSVMDLVRISVPHSSLETLLLSVDDNYHDNTLTCFARVQVLRNFLLQCTNLRVAWIQYSANPFHLDADLSDTTVWTPPSHRGLRPLILLTKLSVYTNLRSSASTLLRDLSLPALKMLTIVGCPSSGFSLIPKGAPLVDTVLRDMPYFARLTALCLARVDVDDEDLFSLLHITTELQKLSVLKVVRRILFPNPVPPRLKAVLLEDSSGLISFLTINESKREDGDCSPPLPHLRTLVLYNGIATVGERTPDTAYAQLAHSRYQWMVKQDNVKHLGVDIPFEKSPFQMCVGVQQTHDDNSRHKTVTAALQDAIGPLHTTILRTVSCHSLDYARGDVQFPFVWS